MKSALPPIAQIFSLILFLFSCAPVWAGAGGSISGTIKDRSGAVIPDVAVIVRNVDTGVERTSSTNGDGFFAFTVIPVGHYEMEISHAGFKPYKRTGLVIDVDTALKVDVPLEVGEQSD